MKWCFIFLMSMFMLSGISLANNVQISNVMILNNGPSNIQVQFDLSWENSWRINTGPANYDGAWVFFKYKTADGNWSHISMTGVNNVISSGFSIYQTTSIKSGTMIFRDASNMSIGTVNIEGIKLGVMNTLPYDIDLKGFAIEMVYVPSNSFRPYYGDGNGVSESQNAFHYNDNTATNSSVIQTKVDANAFDDGELEVDGIYIYNYDTIQLTNPLGTLDPFPTMKSAWCMKYEISQAGYRDFLNTLTVTQQTTRTTFGPTSAVGTRVLPPAAINERNYIEIKTSASGNTPAVYGCDAGNNNTFDEANDGEWVACNFLNWDDVAAYLDWSGLAPMSELQYERFCRGQSSAGAQVANLGEFAWGTSNIYNSTYTLSGAGTSVEVITNNTGTAGNAVWSNTATTPEFGALRNGIFATGSSNRISSGATFYGIMEMTGNVSEYCITIGTVAGRSTHIIPNGNGFISANGNAQLVVGGTGFWPGMEGNVSSSTVNTCSGNCEVTGSAGIMVRGGMWYSSPASTLAIAHRVSVQPVLLPRNDGHGGRGVLYIR